MVALSYRYTLVQVWYLIAFRCGLVNISQATWHQKVHDFELCVLAFSTDSRLERRSESLPSDRNDRVPLFLGRTTGPCRTLLWKRSSFSGPKCIWKPLLTRMLFYSLSNASLPYASQPIDTISTPSRSWSCSPTAHLVLLDLSRLKSACVRQADKGWLIDWKSACVSIVCRLAVVYC